MWSLTHKVHRYLPTEFCYYAYTSSEEEKYCTPCSNGNAAGNILEEAILQGVFELIERDSVALWWYNRVRRPAIDLRSFDEPYLETIERFLERRDRELWVLDLTSDLTVPAFAALSRRTDQPHEHIMIGFGAHFDPRIAVLRAVTELNQGLAWLLPPGAEDPKEIAEKLEDEDLRRWLQTATVENQRYLTPAEGAALRTARDYPKRWTDDLKDDVLVCQELLEKHGMEMLVLDQTRPDIGLPVVKVIIPGLRHFWARFAPGRLYEVPVKLGWLGEPLTEDQLNPIPMFL